MIYKILNIIDFYPVTCATCALGIGILSKIRNTPALSEKKPALSAAEGSNGRHLFMQNKPNFQKAKTNLNHYPTTNYKEKHLSGQRKNKPKQTQFLPSEALAKEGQFTCEYD